VATPTPVLLGPHVYSRRCGRHIRPAVELRGVAQRFLSPAVEQVEEAEDDVLGELRAITAQLGRLEHRLQRERETAA
jgi:hypothetical protein